MRGCDGRAVRDICRFFAGFGIIIDGKRLDEAYKRVKGKDVRYRFVIDLKKSV